MYINSIHVEQFRTFRTCRPDFLHPAQDCSRLGIPTPRLMNVNLLVGDNGLGKTTLLKAVALAALGPEASSSGFDTRGLVRNEPRNGTRQRAASPVSQEAIIEATFSSSQQNRARTLGTITSRITIHRDRDQLQGSSTNGNGSSRLATAKTEGIFCAGYGATRRVEHTQPRALTALTRSPRVAAQRVEGLFADSAALIPLQSWLPQLKRQGSARYKQAVDLINRCLRGSHYEFSGAMDDGEFVFHRQGLDVPFSALSDGYRAFLSWLGDLVYHLHLDCPTGKKLVDHHGIVLVDEIDLHLHPSWQLTLLPTIAKELPHLQFIVTSHSPLVVSSLEWMNILVMQPTAHQASEPKRLDWAVHGLDADQVLLTDFFGLKSTRVEGKSRTLKELTLRARDGDAAAAKQLLDEMSLGSEKR